MHIQFREKAAEEATLAYTPHNFGDLVLIELNFKEERYEILEQKRSWAKYSDTLYNSDLQSELIIKSRKI